MKGLFSHAATRLVASAIVLLGLTLWWLFAGRASSGRGRPVGIRNEWVITPEASFWATAAWLLPLSVLVIFGGLAALSAYDRFHRAKTRREQKTSTIMCLSALSLLAMLWPWSLLGPTSDGETGAFNLVAAMWSDTSNQYFATAYEVEDARQFTREYAARRQTPASRLQAHVATHPPGAVLFHVGARRVFETLPPLQNLFSRLATGLTRQPISEVAAQANEWRRVAARSAAIETTPRPLPVEAVAGALWCAWLLSLAVAAAVPAVYGLAASRSANPADGNVADENAARDVSHANGLAPNPKIQTPNPDEVRGLTAAALWALAPACGLFAFTLDALVACLSAWTLLFFARRLRGGRAWCGVASGAMLGLTSFLSFGALSLWGVVLLGLALQFSARSLLATPPLVLSDLLQRRRPIVHRPLSDIVLCAAGFAALWLLLLLLFPMPIGMIYGNAMRAHHAATVAVRSYGGWVWLNFVLFALFCGWPVAVAVLGGVARRGALWLGRRRRRDIITWETPAVLGIATLLTLGLLTLSGNVRGEAERLWMFALPPLCAFAASVLVPGKAAPDAATANVAAPNAAPSANEPNSPSSRVRFPSWNIVAMLAMLLLQALQTIAMASALAPLVRPF